MDEPLDDIEEIQEEDSLDDQLQGLLNQLDEHEDYITEQITSTAKQPDPPPNTEPSANGDTVVGSTAIPFASDTVQIRRIDPSTEIDTLQPAAPPPLINLNKAFERLELVTEEVLQACRSDRQEAQDTISMLRKEIDAAHKQNLPKERAYIEGIVKMIEVKAGINQNAIKMIEANAKMLAATKAGTNIQVNQSVTATPQDLEELLGEPMGNEID